MTRRRLILNAFVENGVSFGTFGSWRTPGSNQMEFDDLDTWVNLARTLERGKFDSIFFADVLGMYGPYNGEWRQHVHEGLQFPIHDPAALASALAGATQDLGIVFTSSVLQEHPFTFARKVSTLDHISGGRIGWNIVSAFLGSVLENYGRTDLISSEDRYAFAEEYTEVAYKLWEGSWDDGAVLRDRVNGVFSDPEKIHRILHTAPTKEFARGLIADVRDGVRSAGRDPDDIRILQVVMIIPGATEAEAQAKAREVDEYYSVESAIAHFGGGAGIDLGKWGPDTPLNEIAKSLESGGGMLNALIEAAEGEAVTFRDTQVWMRQRNRIIGTPEQIADEFERWQAVGVDGFNLGETLRPRFYEDFVDLVVPELQRRGLVQTEYADGTLRRKVFGGADTAPESHASRRWHGAFQEPEFSVLTATTDRARVSGSDIGGGGRD